MRCCATITTKIPLSLVLSALARSDQLLRARRFFNLQESGINRELLGSFVGHLWPGACSNKTGESPTVLFWISVIPCFDRFLPAPFNV